MQQQDGRGLDYTVEAASQVAAFDHVMARYLASKSDTMACLERLIESGSMPMALCLRGYLLKMASDPRLRQPIVQIISQLEDQRHQGDLNERERAHLEVLTLWSERRDREALARVEAIVDQYPHDMLALKVAHHLHFYSGDSAAVAESVQRRVPAWSRDDPFYGFLLGMLSFGLEEASDYREAELVARQACEINRQDIWAGHAMAHLFHMQGRWVDGVAWLTSMLPAWQDTNNFVNHLYWHKALLHLGRNEYDAAIDIYDQHLAPAIKDDFYLDACNAASLLWRLDLRGVATGDRWQQLYAGTRHRLMDDELAFCSLHYLMPPVVLGEQASVREALGHFSDWGRQQTSQGEVVAGVGMKLAEAIAALGQGDVAGASALTMLRRDIRKIGGSWAQRELFRELREHYREA
ncbi:MAG: tetratricopeptide repeat protein [Proteobacteria bacterium]|jgi:tetratricopeptide (TPR) repeat protein|nr:tetratricopeptide repeat protein [Pseudomonadota bacterium]MDA1298609.1 tetratricopeptide repeat protein [Pseudomonadota bacterium]